MKKGKSIKGIITIAGVSVTALAGWWLMSGGSTQADQVPTFIVQRGSLEINVLQGGEIRALQNAEVKSEIEIPTKILSLIPEGYLITDEDVKEGKVLIELDSTDLKTRIQSHEIEFQTTVSNYIDADENREIQKSENQSFVRDTKQTAIFALMDFEKYLGRDVTASILDTAGLPKDVEAFEKHSDVLETQANTPVSADVAKTKASASEKPPGKKVAVVKTESEIIDFAPFLDQKTQSDGEAQQKLRQLEDEMLLHRSELAVAKQKVESSSRWLEKKFITSAQLENDQVTFEKVSLVREDGGDRSWPCSRSMSSTSSAPRSSLRIARR
jgi:HlyD family secretion protein